MNAPLGHLLGHLPALAFWGPVIWFVPLFGGRHLPAPGRVALALLFSFVVSADPGSPALSGDLPRLLARTLVFGVGGTGAGLLLRLPFDLIRAVGDAAAVSRGTPASWAGQSPAGGRAAPLALALELCLLASAGDLGLDAQSLHLAAGLEARLENTLGHATNTFLAAIPMVSTRASRSADSAAWSASWPTPMALGTWAFGTLLCLACPFLLATWLLDAALGTIGRLLPQLPVFFLAQPLKALLVALLVAAGAPQLIDAGSRAINEVAAMTARAPVGRHP